MCIKSLDKACPIENVLTLSPHSVSKQLCTLGHWGCLCRGHSLLSYRTDTLVRFHLTSSLHSGPLSNPPPCSLPCSGIVQCLSRPVPWWFHSLRAPLTFAGLHICLLLQGLFSHAFKPSSLNPSKRTLASRVPTVAFLELLTFSSSSCSL